MTESAKLLSYRNALLLALTGRRRPSARLQSDVLPEERERCILYWPRHLPAVDTQCLNSEPGCATGVLYGFRCQKEKLSCV